MILVLGDVCIDELVYGRAERFSRDRPGVPVIDVHDRIFCEGGAAAAYRQIEALGEEAYFVPTGQPARKTRIIAVSDTEAEYELARFDERWPVQNSATVTRLIQAGPDHIDTVLYAQYRPTRPLPAIIKTLQKLPGLRVGDVRDPSFFTGALDIVKVSIHDAWDIIEHPKPRKSVQMARGVAITMAIAYGYSWVIITAGKEGYVAVSDEGMEIVESGLPGGVRSVGAGDVFTATLTVLLSRNESMKNALTIANTAAGLACQKNEHLPTVTFEEVQLARAARSPTASGLGQSHVVVSDAGNGLDLPEASGQDRPD